VILRNESGVEEVGVNMLWDWKMVWEYIVK
jgi:hypothetical protein